MWDAIVPEQNETEKTQEQTRQLLCSIQVLCADARNGAREAVIQVIHEACIELLNAAMHISPPFIPLILP